MGVHLVLMDLRPVVQAEGLLATLVAQVELEVTAPLMILQIIKPRPALAAAQVVILASVVVELEPTLEELVAMARPVVEAVVGRLILVQPVAAVALVY
jgi:hypothetical protein